MSDTQFWKDYYQRVAAENSSWLDFSNHRVQLQTLSLALEAAGEIEGKSCLDAGCGRGQLSLLLHVFAPSQLTAFDLIPELVKALSVKIPDVIALAGDASDATFVEKIGAHDAVFCIEMLQYVPHSIVLPLLWRCVAPGGRLIAIAPNGECPIVQKANERFGGRYHGARIEEIGSVLQKLVDCALIAWRPLSFREDQTIQPYEVGAWCSHFNKGTTANRLQLVAIRKS